MEDIPNYIAVPVSILAGFLIAVVIRKFWPTEAEEHQFNNQMFLLSKTFWPIYESTWFITDSLKIHESYEAHRNWRVKLHEEDQKRIDDHYESFSRSRKRLEKINSNSVGEIFYNAMIQYFENGQFLITQGYSEPKFFKRACNGLKIMKEHLKEFEEEYDFHLEIESDGEVVDLSQF